MIGKSMINLKDKSNLYIPLIIFAAALLLRCAALLSMDQNPTSGDPVTYDQYARSIAERGEYACAPGVPTSWRPPLYPLFLAIIYRLTGHNIIIVGIIQAILGALLCVLIYRIAADMFDLKTGMISGLLSGISLYFIAMTKFLLSETLFLFLFLLSLFYFYNAFMQKSSKKAIIAGFLMGLATLTRPITIFYPFLFFGFTAVCCRQWNDILKFTRKLFIPMLIAFLIPLSIWTVRNYRVHKAFVLISTNSGLNLFVGNTPDSNGRYRVRGPDQNEIADIEKITSEPVKNKLYVDRTLRYIAGHPAMTAKLMVMKVAFFWSPFDWCFLGDKGTYNYVYAFILPFSFFGICLLFRKWREYWLLYASILYFFAISLIYYVEPRYRIPAEPFLIIFAGYGIISMYRKYSNKLTPVVITTSWFTINLFAYLYSDAVKIWSRTIFQHLGLW